MFLKSSLRYLAIALLGTTVVTQAQDAPARTSIEVGANGDVLPADKRVVFIGDLHGDFDAFWGVMEMSGLVDDAHRWMSIWQGKVNHMVCTGDFMDRGPYGDKIFEEMKKLQAQAPPGHITILMGNHEQMNMDGNFQQVWAPDSYGSGYERITNVRRAFKHLPPWMKVPLGSESAIVMHGGVTPEAAGHAIEMSADDPVGAMVRETANLEGNLKDFDLLSGRNGLLWYRGYQSTCDHAVTAMERLGVQMMIVGHTPARTTNPGGRIRVKYCGPDNTYPIYWIDAAMSRWMYGRTHDNFLLRKKYRGIYIGCPTALEWTEENGMKELTNPEYRAQVADSVVGKQIKSSLEMVCPNNIETEPCSKWDTTCGRSDPILCANGVKC
eukprot:GFYU01002568.1.p1 GENE.GFYU01002568.1~~GFYU01002568.1.p1  ORF type:complete len:382 (-),score=79.40 GFYU01002568.1:34-1179(-)